MIRLSHATKSIKGEIALPSSKSISNRMLMLRKLYEEDMVLSNISEANDTKVLQRILTSQATSIDVEDAGSAFRFLVAYCACTPGEWDIEGTDRLNKRPIADLVDALRLLGADITYTQTEGHAPLRIVGTELEAKADLIDLTAVKSSQFISALLLISPKVKGRFNIKVNTKMLSYSYVLLTIGCLRRMGFSVWKKGSYIEVSKQQKFDGEHFHIEPDWTSFYYWLSMAHLADEVDVFFPGLRLNNMQKERKLLFEVGNTALRFEELNDGLHVLKTEQGTIECPEVLNFSQFPDSAMTFAMLLPALGCEHIKFKGLDSLKYKECDREKAIAAHLDKVNVLFGDVGEEWEMNGGSFLLPEDTFFESYDDHRMAMCAAPLALVKPILIENESVVSKSYPSFWEDLKKVGFEIGEVCQ